MDDSAPDNPYEYKEVPVTSTVHTSEDKTTPTTIGETEVSLTKKRTTAAPPERLAINGDRDYDHSDGEKDEYSSRSSTNISNVTFEDHGATSKNE